MDFLESVWFYILFVALITGFFLQKGWKTNKHDINNGILVILAATLVALIFYVKYTYRIAETQQKMYFSPRVISWVKGDVIDDSTLSARIIYKNLTEFYVDVATTVKLICFKDTIAYSNDVYTGKSMRTIPPLSTRTGGIPVTNDLLKETRRTIQGLRSLKERKSLILKIDLKLSNNYGEQKNLPTTYNYNFETDAWEEY